MPAGDLASLPDVKSWLSVAGTTSDSILSRLVTSVSSQIRGHLCRSSLISQVWVDRRSGRGNNSFVLRNWPVTSVASVYVGGFLVPQSVQIGGGQGWTQGWYLDPGDWAPPDAGRQAVIRLRGFDFCYGTDNVVVTYTAGYLTAESSVVPASPYTYSIAGSYGPWTADSGVVFTDVTPSQVLIYNPNSGAVTEGQYGLTGETPQQYVFAAADVGRLFSASYSYVPADLEQICIELVGERWRYRDRIGQRSKSLGGQETMSYFGTGIPDYAKEALHIFVDHVPLPP